VLNFSVLSLNLCFLLLLKNYAAGLVALFSLIFSNQAIWDIPDPWHGLQKWPISPLVSCFGIFLFGFTIFQFS
jgi:hypothetical protein